MTEAGSSQVGKDEDYLRRIRDGDEEAFRILFERYAALLRARIRSRLSPALQRKVGVSDVLQEAYLTAFQRIDDFEDRGDGSFGHWLGKIVEYKIRDTVRRYATAKRHGGQEVTQGRRAQTVDFPGRLPSPSQVAMGAELAEAARAALVRLPADYREVIHLLQEQQYSIAEAARRMDRSEAALKKLYERALARFASLLENES